MKNPGQPVEGLSARPFSPCGKQAIMRLWPLIRLPGAWIGGGTIAAVVVLAFFMPFLDRHEGTAAWVQAAGSILIIAATAWFSQRELMRIKTREEQAREEIRKNCAMLARHCLEVLDVVIQRLPVKLISGPDGRGKFIRAYVPSDFELAIERLAAVPLHGVGQTSLATALWELRMAMGRIKRRLDLALDAPIGGMSRNDLNSGLRTDLFNRVAGVIRCVEGNAAENDLSARASFIESPRRAAE